LDDNFLIFNSLGSEKSICFSLPLITADHTATENIINCDVKKSLKNVHVLNWIVVNIWFITAPFAPMLTWVDRSLIDCL